MKKTYKPAYELIKKYQASCEEERVYQDKMLQLLTSGEPCFDRECRVGHFTASAMLLNKEMTHMLLMHHAKIDLWVQPGGHSDGDPDLLNVSLKEAREESGIENIRPLSDEVFDLDIHLFPRRGSDPAHYHFDVRFLLHAYDDDRIIQNHESKALKWVERDLVCFPPEYTSVKRMFEKLKQYKF